MFIKAIPSGPFETNAYVAACPLTKRAVIIDPAPDSADSIQQCLEQNQLTPEKILLTHSHWDHIADVAVLKNLYQIPVFIHPEDAGNLIEPGTDGLPCWYNFEGVNPNGYLNEGDKVQIGQITFIVIHTPGHTPGGICLYCPEENILFSGDTLFQGTIGNLSFPTARPKLMWSSLNKLAKLPAETKVYPGHGPETTIGHENWLSRAEEIFGN
jgi:hydroxyacylglutathione hydrolase